MKDGSKGIAIKRELVGASSTLVVLSILKVGDSYGYEIIQRVRAVSCHSLKWTDGMLYPVLHRLEKGGLIAAYTKNQGRSRRRKYYSITAKGLDQLEDEWSQWQTVNRVFTALGIGTMTANNISVEELGFRLLEYLRVSNGNPQLQLATPLRPLLGGYDTATYQVELRDADRSRSLVLRLYPKHQETEKAIYEGLVQNVLCDQKFPTPKVHQVCTDFSILGGAFILMDYVAGTQLLDAPDEIQSTLLGETHARLLTLDPSDLETALVQVGMNRFKLADRLNWLRSETKKHPELTKVVDWVIDNRPTETRLSICHGDFHKLNVMYENGEVTGVLDWSAFSIAEPEYDVAQTIILFGTVARYLTDEFEATDLDAVVEDYLAGYLRVLPINQEKLTYYRVVRSVTGLIFGLSGRGHWARQGVANALSAYISEVTRESISIQ